MKFVAMSKLEQDKKAKQSYEKVKLRGNNLSLDQ